MKRYGCWKNKKLEAAGWKTGSAYEFLGLSEAESEYIKLKLSLGNSLSLLRKQKKMTQIGRKNKIKPVAGDKDGKRRPFCLARHHHSLYARAGSEKKKLGENVLLIAEPSDSGYWSEENLTCWSIKHQTARQKIRNPSEYRAVHTSGDSGMPTVVSKVSRYPDTFHPFPEWPFQKSWVCQSFWSPWTLSFFKVLQDITGCGIKHPISDLAQLFFMILIVSCLALRPCCSDENKAKSDKPGCYFKGIVNMDFRKAEMTELHDANVSCSQIRFWKWKVFNQKRTYLRFAQNSF